jgi:hypothetical protein
MLAEGWVLPSPQLIEALKVSWVLAEGTLKPGSVKATGARAMKLPSAVARFGREA